MRIWSRIGRRPALGGGNSNGDIPMLRFLDRPAAARRSTTTPSASSTTRRAPRTRSRRRLHDDQRQERLGDRVRVSRDVVPPWLRSYRRAWLRPGPDRGGGDLERGDAAGGRVRADRRAAAGGRADGGAGGDGGLRLAGTSRQLVVSATTATSAVSAATVGPLAGGDVGALRGALGRAGARGRNRAGRSAALLRFGADLRPRLQAGDDRLPVRPRAGHRARAAARAAGRRARRGELLPGAERTCSASSARCTARRWPSAPARWPCSSLGRRLRAGAAVDARRARRWRSRCRRSLGLEDHGVDVVGDIPDGAARPGDPRRRADDLGWRSSPPPSACSILSAEAVGVARALGGQARLPRRPRPRPGGDGRVERARRASRPASCSPAARARPPPPTAPAVAASSHRSSPRACCC